MRHIAQPYFSPVCFALAANLPGQNEQCNASASLAWTRPCGAGLPGLRNRLSQCPSADIPCRPSSRHQTRLARQRIGCTDILVTAASFGLSSEQLRSAERHGHQQYHRHHGAAAVPLRPRVRERPARPATRALALRLLRRKLDLGSHRTMARGKHEPSPGPVTGVVIEIIAHAYGVCEIRK